MGVISMAFRGFGPKITKGGHIKGSTLGTSNEISFSVLDAKKQQQETKDSQPKVSALGRVSLFSLPGKKSVSSTPKRAEGLHLSTGEFVSGTPVEQTPAAQKPGTLLTASVSTGSSSVGVTSQSKEPPSAETQAKRKRTAKGVFAVAGVICLIAAIAVGVYGVVNKAYEDYLNNQSYAEILLSALTSVENADQTLAVLDGSLSNMLSEKSLADMEVASAGMRTAADYLDRAQNLAERALSGMTDSSDIEAAEAALATIEARRSMMTAGQSLIDQSFAANEAIELLKASWEETLSADAEARTAISKVAGAQFLDSTNMNSAKAQAQVAISGFENAKAGFEAAAEVFNVSVDAYLQYLDLRIEGLRNFEAACAAVLLEDVATASAQMAEYNDKDAQAVRVASGFPQNVASLVEEPFKKAVEPLSKDYAAAAEEASANDSVLRKYLA